MPVTGAAARPPLLVDEESVFDWMQLHVRELLIALLLVVVLVAPQPARGQFIIDWAAIVAAINGIGTAINNVIGSGLQAINSALGAVNNILSTVNSFFQNQIYPQATIDRARGVVGAVQSIYNAIRGLVNLNVASATLANPQQLESVILSRNPGRSGAPSWPQSEFATAISYLPPPAAFRRWMISAQATYGASSEDEVRSASLI